MKKVQKGMNRVAVNLTKREGKTKNLPVSEIKEVLKCLRQECYLSPKSKRTVKKYLRF